MLILIIAKYLPDLLCIFPTIILEHIYEDHRFVVKRYDFFEQGVYNLQEYLELNK